MAYRAKHIEDFINKVNKEAEEVAQAVYDKHQARLNELLTNQVLKGDKLIVGNGTAVVIQDRVKLYRGEVYAEKFCDVLAEMQYNRLMVGFDIIDVDKRNVKFQH